jgi:NAD(P)-dependent dehydrogenase (short-subunit alcohol dehydrogenase family)
MQELRGRAAVVTGGASGIGAALCRRLAREGMRVVVADRDEAGARTLAEEICGAGGEAHAFPVDVGDAPSLGALASSARDAVGPCRALFANVGVQQMGRLDRVDDRDWEWLWQVNVLGTAHTVQAFLPQLREGGEGGQVVVTASTQAVLPVPNLGVYTASKYAVLAYGETLRLELAEEGIGVTVLFPGPTRTNHLRSSAAARPAALGPSITAPEDIPTVAAATLSGAGDLVDPDHAVRHVAHALREDWAYWVTHPPHRERAAARFQEILRAFDRAAE